MRRGQSSPFESKDTQFCSDYGEIQMQYVRSNYRNLKFMIKIRYREFECCKMLKQIFTTLLKCGMNRYKNKDKKKRKSKYKKKDNNSFQQSININQIIFFSLFTNMLLQ